LHKGAWSAQTSALTLYIQRNSRAAHRMVALEIWTYALRAYAATPQWASQHERSNRLLEETFRWRQEVSRQRGHAGVSERERNGTDVLEVAPVGVTGRSFGGWGLGMRGRTLLLSDEGVEENSCDEEASQSESESSDEVVSSSTMSGCQ